MNKKLKEKIEELQMIITFKAGVCFGIWLSLWVTTFFNKYADFFLVIFSIFNLILLIFLGIKLKKQGKLESKWE